MKLRRILAGTATVMLIGAGSVVATVPAQAAEDPALKVCNSTASVGTIKAYYSGHPFDVPLYYLGLGECKTMNGGSQVRVDVNPNESGGPDVDSYYIGQIGNGYGPCHNGENTASDPPYDPDGVRYNTNQGHC